MIIDRGTLLLGAGALAGALIAATGLLESAAPPAAAPADFAARVNGVTITAAQLERHAKTVAAGARTAPDDETRKKVLDRLIEEELLVQYGLELGLASRDQNVRAQLAGAVVELVKAREDPEPDPTEADLRTFYEEHQDYFRPPARLQLRQLFFARHITNEGEAAERGQAAREALASGQPWESVATDPPPVPVPDGWLNETDLVRYIGATVARATLEVTAGGLTAPTHSGAGYHIVQVLAREDPSPPPFERARPRIEAEWQRRAGERRLRRFLDQRRAAAHVELP